MRASQYLPRFTTLPPGARLVVGQGLLNKVGEKLVVYHGISPGGRPHTECIPAAAAAEREAADAPAPAAAPVPAAVVSLGSLYRQHVPLSPASRSQDLSLLVARLLARSSACLPTFIHPYLFISSLSCMHICMYRIHGQLGEEATRGDIDAGSSCRCSGAEAGGGSGRERRRPRRCDGIGFGGEGAAERVVAGEDGQDSAANTFTTGL